MIITQPLEIATSDGTPTGRWRLVVMSDEDGAPSPLCSCGGSADSAPEACGHASPEEARTCPIAYARVDQHAARAAANLSDLAKTAFDAYTASTGGKTYDGKDIPPYEVIAKRTPHLARAWEVAAAAILRAREESL